jgi:hypothetical protein
VPRLVLVSPAAGRASESLQRTRLGRLDSEADRDSFRVSEDSEPVDLGLKPRPDGPGGLQCNST